MVVNVCVALQRLGSFALRLRLLCRGLARVSTALAGLNVCVALQRLGGELVKAVAVVNVCVAFQRFGGQ